jgi:hypothetical protein
MMHKISIQALGFHCICSIAFSGPSFKLTAVLQENMVAPALACQYVRLALITNFGFQSYANR